MVESSASDHKYHRYIKNGFSIEGPILKNRVCDNLSAANFRFYGQCFTIDPWVL